MAQPHCWQQHSKQQHKNNAACFLAASHAIISWQSCMDCSSNSKSKRYTPANARRVCMAVLVHAMTDVLSAISA
eukprot:365857-Chlamydomonas_euryale.AAC.7